jgi:hypothetical protein
MLEGHGYELTGIDVIDAYGHFLRAAEKLGVTQDARNDVLSMATQAKQSGTPFADILIRQCTPGSLPVNRA